MVRRKRKSFSIMFMTGMPLLSLPCIPSSGLCVRQGNFQVWRLLEIKDIWIPPRKRTPVFGTGDDRGTVFVGGSGVLQEACNGVTR